MIVGEGGKKKSVRFLSAIFWHLQGVKSYSQFRHTYLGDTLKHNS